MLRNLSLLTIACLLQGCSGVESKKADPDALPKALNKIEQITDEVFAAFEENRPKDADGPMHDVGRTLANFTNHIGSLELDEAQKESISQAVKAILDGYAEMHRPMHTKQFNEEGKLPDDFDFNSIASNVREGLEGLKTALPAEVLQRAEELSE